MITLVTGGARSGKSTWALEQALQCPAPRIFLATAQAFDTEMHARIEQHKNERGSTFKTIEEPLQLRTALQSIGTGQSIVLLDCLTVWLGNQFHRHNDNPLLVRPEVDALIEAIGQTAYNLIIVTNELGMGIVPDNLLARDFRDMQGYLNRHVAQVAHRVIFMVSGLPLTIK